MKISVIGAGNVGANCAQRIAEGGYASVVLVDIVPGLAEGKALDMLESAHILNTDLALRGSSDYKDTAGSELAVITAGLARKPGMSREQLLAANAEIVGGVVANIVKHSPQCVILMVTNPLDVMTYLALKTSKFPRERVVGLSGVLDGGRLSAFIAAELKVSVKDVTPCVLGAHGPSMVVVPRLTTVKSRPLTKLLPQEAIDRLIKRTVEAGAEIVALLKTGSAFYAPSAAAARMAGAIVGDKKEVMLGAAYLEGEYGISGSIVGVPLRLGRQGIEEIVELELTAGEKQALQASAEGVRELIKTLGV